MFRGEKVWLRAPRRSDFEPSSAGAVSDAETAHGMGLKRPVSPEEGDEYFRQITSQQGKTLFAFTICELDDERGVGDISLREIDRENGSAELTIVIIDKAAQNRGVGTDAVNCILDFGFGELRLERIYLHVFDYNARAIRAYEKAGFQTDAVLRNARFHRGTHHDVNVMSVLRADWLAAPRRRAWEPRD